jgi:hypothetical protein
MVNTSAVYQTGVSRLSVGSGLSLSPSTGTGALTITNTNPTPTIINLSSPDNSLTITPSSGSTAFQLQVTPSVFQSFTNTTGYTLINGGTFVTNVGQHTVTIACAFNTYTPAPGQEEDFDFPVTLPPPVTPSPGQRVFLGQGEYYASQPGVPRVRFFISVFSTGGMTYFHFQVDPLSVILGGEAGSGSYGKFIAYYPYTYGVYDGTTLTTYNFTATYQI